MSTQISHQVIEDFYTHCNDQNSDDIVNLFSETAILSCPGVGELSGGDILKYISGVMSECPGMKFSVREIISMKPSNDCAEELLVLWRGEIPDGIYDREGLVVVDGIDRLKIDSDGAISKMEAFYDRIPLAADMFLSTAEKAVKYNI